MQMDSRRLPSVQTFDVLSTSAPMQCNISHTVGKPSGSANLQDRTAWPSLPFWPRLAPLRIAQYKMAGHA